MGWSFVFLGKGQFELVLDNLLFAGVHKSYCSQTWVQNGIRVLLDIETSLTCSVNTCRGLGICQALRLSLMRIQE